MGPEACVHTFAPMLKEKANDPKASLIMLFMNATPEEHYSQPMILKQEALKTSMVHLNRIWPLDSAFLKLLQNYPGDFKQSAEFVARSMCNDMFLDFDKLFRSVLKETIRHAIANGMRVKNKHTIIDKWPYRVSDTMTKKEFDALRASSLMGYERYMELERV
jgi:hypothetical protein